MLSQSVDTGHIWTINTAALCCLCMNHTYCICGTQILWHCVLSVCKSQILWHCVLSVCRSQIMWHCVLCTDHILWHYVLCVDHILWHCVLCVDHRDCGTVYCLCVDHRDWHCLWIIGTVALCTVCGSQILQQCAMCGPKILQHQHCTVWTTDTVALIYSLEKIGKVITAGITTRPLAQVVSIQRCVCGDI